MRGAGTALKPHRGCFYVILLFTNIIFRAVPGETSGAVRENQGTNSGRALPEVAEEVPAGASSYLWEACVRWLLAAWVRQLCGRLDGFSCGVALVCLLL